MNCDLIIDETYQYIKSSLQIDIKIFSIVLMYQW